MTIIVILPTLRLRPRSQRIWWVVWGAIVAKPTKLTRLSPRTVAFVEILNRGRVAGHAVEFAGARALLSFTVGLEQNWILNLACVLMTCLRSCWRRFNWRLTVLLV